MGHFLLVFFSLKPQLRSLNSNRHVYYAVRVTSQNDSHNARNGSRLIRWKSACKSDTWSRLCFSTYSFVDRTVTPDRGQLSNSDCLLSQFLHNFPRHWRCLDALGIVRLVLSSRHFRFFLHFLLFKNIFQRTHNKKIINQRENNTKSSTCPIYLTNVLT